MVKLKVENNNNYEYKLKDENEKEYNINIEFLDTDVIPKDGDYIYLHAELLNPRYDGYSRTYTFGLMTSAYGRNDLELNDIDIIKIEAGKKTIYLKRLYG